MWTVETICMNVMFIASYCSYACSIKTLKESKRRTPLTYMYFCMTWLIISTIKTIPLKTSTGAGKRSDLFSYWVSMPLWLIDRDCFGIGLSLSLLTCLFTTGMRHCVTPIRHTCNSLCDYLRTYSGISCWEESVWYCSTKEKLELACGYCTSLTKL